MNIKYKMGNYRQMLWYNECLEVEVNEKDKEKPHKCMKNLKNFLSDYSVRVD